MPYYMKPNDTIRAEVYQWLLPFADVIGALVKIDSPTWFDFIGTVQEDYIGVVRMDSLLNSQYLDWHTRADVSAVL